MRWIRTKKEMLINLEYVQQIYMTEKSIEVVLVEPRGCRGLCQLWKGKNVKQMFNAIEVAISGDDEIIDIDLIEKNLIV